MAIELGLLLLINSSISSPPFTNGAIAELPKNISYPAYAIRWISEPENLGVGTTYNLKYARIEIRCFGDPQGNGGDQLTLAADITQAMQGYAGTLPDPDHTKVSSIFKTDQMDLSIDPDTRAYRRMIEFQVFYW